MLSERAIIHLNIADFAVAVERVMDHRLNGRPVIIAPRTSARAMVYDMSEEAYQAGVRKHMALPRALRRCRDAKVLPPHPERYEKAMGTLMKQALPYSPLVENGEQDGHLFADVSGTSRLFGPPVDIAWRLCRHVKERLGMNPIWSVASNRLVAKVATRLVKPWGEYVVGGGEEALFLAPLPVDIVPGIEPEDLRRLREFNLTRVSHVTALSPYQLQVLFGARASFVHDILRGIDSSPVLPAGEQPPVVNVDRVFDEDTNHFPLLRTALYGLVERAGRMLRRQRLAAGRIAVMLDYSDGAACARRRALKPASANDPTLFETVLQVFMSAWKRRVRIRRLRLVCDRLIFPPAQLPLFEEGRREKARRDSLMQVVDRIRDRFGLQALRVGAVDLPAQR